MSSTSQKEAIYLFVDSTVNQGYWLTEFEQKVRDQSKIGEFNSQTVKAAYVVIGPQDFAQAMVLFNLPVNERGFVNTDWYIPLRRLADSAGHGPNMGDGRIRLTCHSQCSISWHKDSMWEPVTSDFMAIRKAIRDNLIGQKPLKLSANHEQPSSSLKMGSAVASALSKRHEDPEVEQLKAALKTETLAYRNQLQQLQTEIERQKSLTEKAHRQAADDEVVQELAELKHIHHAEMQKYQQEINELEKTLAQQQEAYEALQAKAGQQQEVSHSLEVDALKEQLALAQEALVLSEERSIDHFISRVDALEAVMVCFHPGAGHLTINAENMQAYAENPTAYAAKKCAVDEEQYSTWLDHYDDPKCQECRCEIPRVEHPQDFKLHLQGFCSLHRSMKDNLK